jgi:hypothetical protein
VGARDVRCARRLLGLPPQVSSCPENQPLGEGVVRALQSSPAALVGTKIATGHYEAFFRWHSENLRGYRGLYEQFSMVIDRAAEEARKPDFAICDLKLRRDILQRMASV